MQNLLPPSRHFYKVFIYWQTFQNQNFIMKSLYFLSIGLMLFACQTSVKKEVQAEVVPSQAHDAEARLQELGIVLPEVGAPVANYVNTVRTGNLVFTSGKGPQQPDGTYVTGKVGADLTTEQGYEAARLTAIQQLASLKAELGDLNKVKRIVKVLGMVNAAPGFTEQSQVINGFSDLMVEVFGEKGKHARSAVGMGSLPSGIACEIEMIVEVED
jgi:enamine deaminase RidA (YjgF/YER057c/UK114 family)